ncbi:hypothetical protein [Fibrella forsythiae]|uniref:Uncharacterized protein n=1 Tax=Fibrella forsythiae TaxID=2817061 RepID=A0ABS3JRF2_9BACT|nr:hypothetical protein [Fibrella forsythiae]MBO0952568.1 hypothetical protein [Fibrella forsythiae]
MKNDVYLLSFLASIGFTPYYTGVFGNTPVRLPATMMHRLIGQLFWPNYLRLSCLTHLIACGSNQVAAPDGFTNR